MNPLAALSLGGQMPPSTLDGMLVNQILANNQLAGQSQNPAQAGFIPGLSIKSFYGERLYDTARIAAATALPASEFSLFANPIGTQQVELNGTTQYTKSKLDTNMTASRQLPAGQYAWITSIQVRVAIVGSLDDSVQTGANLGLPLAPGTGASLVAADDIVAVTMAQAMLESIVMTFVYNQTPFESGPLYLFPTRYVFSGVSGGGLYSLGTTGPGIFQNETLINNGMGIVYTLPVVRQIDSLYNFAVNLQALNPFVPTRNTRITVILEGLGAKAVTG